MFLKRAGWSLWRHKFRNILVLLVFSAILAVTLTSFMIYAGTSYQVEVTQKAVANAVTLTGPTLNGLGSTSYFNMDYTYADRFTNGPHVERYNIVMTYVDMESPGLVPAGLTQHEEDLYKRYMERVQSFDGGYAEALGSWANDVMSMMYSTKKHNDTGYEFRYELKTVEDENGSDYLEYDIYDGRLSEEENAQRLSDLNMLTFRSLDGEPVPDGFRITAISDSEYYDAFANEGYSLVEGRHFKSEEEDKPYVLLSKAVAQASGIQVGDKIPFEFSSTIKSMATFYKDKPIELEVIGLFDPPEKDLLGDIGYKAKAQNMVFMPYQAVIDYMYDLYNGETLLWTPDTNRATVYIDEPENVQEFVDYAYDTFRIVEINPKTGQPVGTSLEEMIDEKTFGSDDPDVVDAGFMQLAWGAYSLNPWFTLSIDRDWYDMVAMPMESLSSLSLFMGIGLLAGAFVALLLVCIFNVRARKREVGVLLSMGESKLKVCAQMFIEQALPLVLAAAIGFGAGTPLAGALGNSLLESRANQVNAAYEQDKRDFLENQMSGNAVTVENSMTIRSAANVASPVQMQFTLDTTLAWGYFALAFGMLFLTVFIQMVFLLRLSPAKIMTRRN